MSFLVGPVSGALVAGGVYYGFSNLIHTRTEQRQRDIHTLSVRLTETSSLIRAPPSAATRISDRTFSTYVQSRWNQELAYLFVGIGDWDRRAREWGRKVLYGGEDEAVKVKKLS
ncbi:hypothetical protein BDQ12DRAFT_729590 [Crucibulum laeve]|uniref:Found in mitochondrial proteome protein 51 n=1 Tax=Crucibulum laeve TaxID=68775 RepID=A0A5C3LE77_9AGAR|nr:hypothetical protein BDQ12DRAFT_729590 [Crucibulum laeve]